MVMQQITDHPAVKNIIAQRESALTMCAILNAEVTVLREQNASLQKQLFELTEALEPVE
jgi:hypothetical protein